MGLKQTLSFLKTENQGRSLAAHADEVARREGGCLWELIDNPYGVGVSASTGNRVPGLQRARYAGTKQAALERTTPATFVYPERSASLSVRRGAVPSSQRGVTPPTHRAESLPPLGNRHASIKLPQNEVNSPEERCADGLPRILVLMKLYLRANSLQASRRRGQPRRRHRWH